MIAHSLRRVWGNMLSWRMVIWLNGLEKRLGTCFKPYYVVFEGRFLENPPPVKDLHRAFKIVSFDNQDMKAMADIPGRDISEEALLARLKKGKKCFGIKYQDEMAAFTWVDFDESGIWCSRFFLKPTEAYLFDTYTLACFRGKGLAPCIHYHVYGELEKMGIERIYSISDCFNESAQRFKEKLGARVIELRLLIMVFEKWKFDIRLREYV